MNKVNENDGSKFEDIMCNSKEQLVVSHEQYISYYCIYIYKRTKCLFSSLMMMKFIY